MVSEGVPHEPLDKQNSLGHGFKRSIHVSRPAKNRRKDDPRASRPDSLDFRDWIYEPELVPLDEYRLPKSRLIRVLDQGEEGACTGFGLAAVINYLLRRRDGDSAEQVSARMLYEMAKRHEAEVVEPTADWYGMDPIHIKRGYQPTAWQAILASWSDAESTARAELSLLSDLHLHSLRPQQRKLFGIAQQRRQPTGKLDDGSWISLY